MNTPMTIRERRFEFVAEAITAHLARQPEKAAEAVNAIRELDRHEANRLLCGMFAAPLPVRQMLAGRTDEAVELLKRIYAGVDDDNGDS